MKVKLDEKHLVTSDSAIIIISNPKTLTCTMTHQGVQEVVVPNWHDVNYEQLFFLNSSNLHTLQQIRMTDENFVKKLKKNYMKEGGKA